MKKNLIFKAGLIYRETVAWKENCIEGGRINIVIVIFPNQEDDIKIIFLDVINNSLSK